MLQVLSSLVRLSTLLSPLSSLLSPLLALYAPSARCRTADGVMIVFDIADQRSFDASDEWLQRVERFAPHRAARNLVGVLKSGHERAVSRTSAAAFAAKHGLTYIEVGEGIDAQPVSAAFTALVREMRDGHAVIAAGSHPLAEAVPSCLPLLCPPWPGLLSSLGWATGVSEPWKEASEDRARVMQDAEVHARSSDRRFRT